jgi:hypothetical protein
MPNRIRIVLEKGELEAVLDDSPTAIAIQAALPLQGDVARWGDEIYFTVPVRVEEAEDARQDMAIGELGYWPVGAAFCIFWGPTPASTGPLPRAYSNVNPFGKIEGEREAVLAVLSTARDGQAISVLPAAREETSGF